jgi:curved DNA-binding protein CbpA
MTSPERRDPYSVLGVPRQASAAEIARAYRRAARASHPDSGVAGSAERFRAVSDAYDQLRDPRRRAMYDRSHPLARSPTASTPHGSVRYAAPGSQHVVLGRSALIVPQDRPSFDDEGRSVRLRGDIEGLAQLALSLLRGGWL